MLENDLGKVMTAKQVAEYLGLAVKTVRDYYRQLGGIRIGRSYRFFEKEVSNAIQTWKQIHRTGEEEQQQEREGVQHQKRGPGMGSRNAENARRRMERPNNHGLLD
jgi:excisionase family DNA binding protein